MQIIYRDIHELKKLDNNPRTISDSQLAKLKESISNNKDYFEARPIILSNRTGELIIIAGNQRYEACIALGIKQVPTFLIENLTEEREREIIIRDNVNNGEWDMQKLMSWNIDKLNDWGIDMNFDIEPESTGTEYTKKIEAPVYEPKKESAPHIMELTDTSKYNQLIDRIHSANIPDEVKHFLKIAASRHIVFDYGEIAEYYAHATKEIQQLMEDSALVIIDYDKAIENGYTKLKNDIYDVMLEDTDDEE